MTALKPSEIPVEKKLLHCPPLEEIVGVLNNGLKKNFAEVNVQVVDCPDLTKQPFTLACPGLGGSPRLIELGGVPYLLPLVKREKLYDLKDVASLAELPSAFIIGAGAGPWPYMGVNCELMANLEIKGGKVNNQTRVAKVNTKDGSCILETLPDDETRNALLGNMFASEGKPGKVLQVKCTKRIGEDDFAASIRKTLQNHYKEKPVGLGGTFLIENSKAKLHVMPEFSKVALTSENDLNNWLKFYNLSSPLIVVGTLASADPGLDLRVQHFHSFSHHGDGGHYHIDTEPDTVEYLGYFAVAESVYRMDRPKETHQMGRD